ncbi:MULTISPECIES: hypothetical protein [unclassified Lentimonas]|uniref:hypothetical protein n=1 Tax=unclassified Lentimonas TaxID=2630993 RepID=UPI0013221372|nr:MULTISPECIES: hypothetical protein [unclassified Lentimonas]CAA6690604.1 Unannotated [Lentimonas sp. CC10]CAA6695265.1 Unannotated [Lentimonas sp. CC19]CAA7068861.1 Unannotated [Lentimonas sp. CC11]
MHLRNLIKTSLIAAACLTFGIALFASESKLESDSPFLPPGYNNKKPEPPKPVKQVNGPLSRELEFRGVVQLEGVYQFSLFQKSENRGYWIAENGSENGISVRDFKIKTMTITVTLNGRAEQLTLMTATDSPLPVATSPAAQPQKQPSRPNIPGLNTTSKRPSTSNRVIPRRRVILPKK